MSQLQTNLTNLQEILNQVNNLPSAESNGINLNEELENQNILLLEQEEKIIELSNNLYKLRPETCTVILSWVSGGIEWGHTIYYLNEHQILSMVDSAEFADNDLEINVMKNSIIYTPRYTYQSSNGGLAIDANEEGDCHAAVIQNDCTLYF